MITIITIVLFLTIYKNNSLLTIINGNFHISKMEIEVGLIIFWFISIFILLNDNYEKFSHILLIILIMCIIGSVLLLAIKFIFKIKRTYIESVFYNLQHFYIWKTIILLNLFYYILKIY